MLQTRLDIPVFIYLFFFFFSFFNLIRFCFPLLRGVVLLPRNPQYPRVYEMPESHHFNALFK